MICPPKVGQHNQLIKVQIFYGQIKLSFETFEQQEKTIHEYIYYDNHERIQVKLKGLSP